LELINVRQEGMHTNINMTKETRVSRI
jgi:hypothetical protein